MIRFDADPVGIYESISKELEPTIIWAEALDAANAFNIVFMFIVLRLVLVSKM